MRTTSRRLAFDTNALIYFVEQYPPYYEWLVPLFAEIARGDCTAIVSVLAQAEALVGSYLRRDVGTERAFDQLFASPNVIIAEVDAGLALQAARLKATTRLALPDSVIIETAKVWRCDALIGNDGDWRKHPLGISYVHLDDAVGI